jgi:hypothetical protein
MDYSFGAVVDILLFSHHEVPIKHNYAIMRVYLQNHTT